MFGFAKKIGMTRLFIDEKAVPVTALEVDKNYVIQVRTEDKDGYKAVQIGAFARKGKSASKAKLGHIKKQAGLDNDFYCIGEFRDAEVDQEKKHFDINDLEVGSHLDLTAKMMGRGFTGAVKRHGFAGQPRSHGHDHVRAVGSIGTRWPQRVLPGKRMAGHSGNENITVKNLKVVAIDTENNLIFVAGSVPGTNSHYVRFQKSKNK